MASGDKVYIADKATLDEVKGKIGSASDTGGSSTLGTVMAKENAILAEVGKIGATNDAQGTETTGSVMAKLNYLVNQVSRYLYNIYAWVNAVISGIGSTTDTGGTTTTGTLMAKENAILTEVNKIGATSETGATVTTGTTMGKLNNLINKINRVSNKENDLIRAGINAFGIQAKNLPSTEIEILNVKGEGYVTGIALTGAYGDAKTIRTKVYVDGELFFDFGITINTAQNSLNAKGLVFGVNSNESTMVYNMCNLANFINGNTGIVGCYYTYLSTPLYFADSLRVTASSTVTDENNYVSIGYGLVGLRENMGYVTIQLLPLEQMKIVEGGYSSMAEFTAGGNTMQQSVVNGDFAQGTTGWNADSAIISAANKILTITGNGLSAFPQAGKTETEIIVNGKYFIKGRCRLNTAYAGTAFLAVQIKGTTGGSFAQKIQNPIVGTWYDIYAIADASTFSGNIRVILYGQFADAATANGKVIEVDGNVGVFAIPITGTPFENMAASEINANISEYWGGLKSVEKVEVVSRGRNLFDGVLEVGSISSTTGLPTVFASKSRSANFIRLKPSTAYKISITTGETFDLALWYYDHNKKFISYVDPYGLPVFTTPSNCEFMKFVNHSTDSPSYSIQLNEGSTALPYEENRGSTSNITCTDNTKFDLARLPNGVENTVEFVDGRYKAVKRVERYVLPSSYFYSISTGGTITDAVLVTKPTGDKLIDITSRAILSFQFEGFETYNVLTMDSDIAIGKACNMSTLKYGLIVPKGTYADIDAARTALTGTVIYYELATPVTIKEEDFAAYGIEAQGTLTSNNGYTEFYTNAKPIFSNVSVKYAADR